MAASDLKSSAFPSPDFVCLTSSVFAAWMIYPGAISLTFPRLSKTVAFEIDLHCLKSLAFEFFKELEQLQDKLATRTF